MRVRVRVSVRVRVMVRVAEQMVAFTARSGLKQTAIEVWG